MDDPYSDDERTVELSTIAAIFPELQVSPDDPYNATLDLAVTPLKPLKIRFQEALVDPAPPQLPTPPLSNGQDAAVNVGARDKNGRDATPEGVHELEHLPRVRLELSLPDTYPASQPPTIQLSVLPCWVSHQKLEELKQDCIRLWEEIGHDQVVYLFIDHLQQQAENAFGLADGEAVPMPADLRLELLDFDQKAKREKFEKETFDCGICLEPKKGKECHRLMLCGHVFCVACLQDFYGNCISEGDVDNVKCMDPTCGKDSEDGQPVRKRKRREQTLNPSELLQIPIDSDAVKRYVRLKRKQKLESDKNTIYCPRQWCQGAARSKKHPKPTDLMDDFGSDSEPETESQPPVDDKKKTKTKPQEDIPMAMRLAVCEDCDFAFCCVCKKGWHGEWAVCSPRRTKELLEEERKTLEYLKHYSTPCPTCDAPCQKTHGCNHMCCFKCRTHFCYLCSSWLDPDNPYKHFNDMAGNCYMRLWELEQGDGEGVVQRGFNDWDIPDDDPVDEEPPPQAGGMGMAALAQEVEAVAANPAGNVVDESDSDEEVAPDVVQRRRERAIEFVNFAAGGEQQAQRVILPDQVEEPPAQPPAHAQAQQQDNAPRRRRQRQRQRQRRQQEGDGGRNARAPNGMPNAHAPAPAQAAPPAAPPPPLDQAALQRFIELAQRDEEDEWDSDELPEELAFGEGDDDSDDDHQDAQVPQQLMNRIDARQMMNRANRRGMERF